MLKILAIVSFCLFAFIRVIPCQAQEKVANGNGSAQNSATDQRGTKDSPLVVDARTIFGDKEAAEETKKYAEQKRTNRWNIGLTFAIALCAFLQVIGISAQVIVYLKQTGIMRATLTAISGQATTMEQQLAEMRVQRTQTVEEMRLQAYQMEQQASASNAAARAAEKSADAALLSAQVVINSERARLLFEVEKSSTLEMRGRSIFTIYAVNYGRVPAELLGYKNPVEEVRNSSFDLPIPIPDSPVLPIPRKFLAPKEKYLLAEWVPASSKNDLRGIQLAGEGKASILKQARMIYGEIIYRDGVSNDIRISRYCFRFERRPFKNIGGSIVPDGPPEYNEQT